MGCDIHCYIDYSPFADNPSYAHCLCEFFMLRNYDLFGLLAGVRGAGPAVVPPKGLPEHVSFMVQDEVFEYEDEKGLIKKADYHTHSWLTVEELAEVIYKYDERYGRRVGSEMIAVYECMDVFDKEGKNPRLVFWFDN